MIKRNIFLIIIFHFLSTSLFAQGEKNYCSKGKFLMAFYLLRNEREIRMVWWCHREEIYEAKSSISIWDTSRSGKARAPNEILMWKCNKKINEWENLKLERRIITWKFSNALENKIYWRLKIFHKCMRCFFSFRMKKLWENFACPVCVSFRGYVWLIACIPNPLWSLALNHSHCMTLHDLYSIM